MTIEFWQAGTFTMLVSGVILNLYLKLAHVRYELQKLESGLEYLERKMIQLQVDMEYERKEENGKSDFGD